MSMFQLMCELFIACVNFIIIPLSIAVPVVSLMYVIFKGSPYKLFSIILIGMLASSNLLAHATGVVDSANIQALSVLLSCTVILVNHN